MSESLPTRDNIHALCLFPQGDEKALAGTIMKLIDDKDLYERVSAACSRRAADFGIRNTAAAYLKIYEEVVCRRS